jgi:hypothetical protein
MKWLPGVPNNHSERGEGSFFDAHPADSLARYAFGFASLVLSCFRGGQSWSRTAIRGNELKPSKRVRRVRIHKTFPAAR